MKQDNTKRVSVAEQQDDFQELKGFYGEMLTYIERLHRLLLDVIKAELDQQQIVEINSVQALLLHNIGSMELTAGELKSRGYYQGSNVSYNLKKLVDMEYVNYERSHIDKRSVRVKLTPKGAYIADMISQMYHRHAKNVQSRRLIDVAGLEDICLVCKDFERFWTDAIRYG